MPDERFRFNETIKKGCALNCAVSRATKNRQGNLPICKDCLRRWPFQIPERPEGDESESGGDLENALACDLHVIEGSSTFLDAFSPVSWLAAAMCHGYNKDVILLEGVKDGVRKNVGQGSSNVLLYEPPLFGRLNNFF